MSTPNDEPSENNGEGEPEIDETIFNHCIASYQQQCNDELEEERTKIREMWSKGLVDIIHEVYNKFKDWQGPPPTLSENYDDEIKDKMLMEAILNRYGCQTYEQRLWLVKYLIHTGYKDVPKVDNDGRPMLHRSTPLLEAAKQEESDLVRELFKIYDRNYTDDSGLTHFHAACWHGCVDAVQQFLELGEDPNHVWPKSGDSPLHMALFKRHKDVAKCLLRKGTNPNVATTGGLTILHFIIKYTEDDELAEMFFNVFNNMEPKVNVNARDKLGNTPLHFALATRRVRIAELLLRKGADSNSTNDEGKTPVHTLFMTHWDENLVEVFLKINAEIGQSVRLDIADNLGCTPIDYAKANILPVDILSILR
ncbi:hypothetical protein TKK_0004683 [Trichogramma kaykai]